MGARNPDRIPMAYRRRGCETIGDMHRLSWDVIAVCRQCGLAMRVDLPALIRLKGARLSLWNRKARCRRIGCTGAVEFQGRPPDLYSHQPLTAPWPE